MNRRSWRVAAVASVLLVATAIPAAAAPTATQLFRFQDSRIDEASGIALATRSPNVVFVQNDSGDSARFFAVDDRTGTTRAVYTVPGAQNVDWEDLAVANGYVWLADIGDNRAKRTSIQLYRVDEPVVPSDAVGDTLTTGASTVWQLRYPDGAHDAETLIIDDTGQAYVVTKSFDGRSGVYEVPTSPGASVQTMRKVGEVRLVLATGGAFSDGVLVIRTYAAAYVWNAPDGVTAALSTAPQRVALPAQKQGEGVCISAGNLLVDSEGEHQPVYAVPFAKAIHDSTPTPGPTVTVDGGPKVEPRKHGLTGVGLLLILAGSSVAFFAVGFAVAGLVVLVRRRRRV